MDPLVIKLIAVLFWAVVVGLLAKRKNRNPIGWGLAGDLRRYALKRGGIISNKIDYRIT